MFLPFPTRLVRVLLDEVMSSTIDRCVDPVLMEHSVSHMISHVIIDMFIMCCSIQVVEVICEKS